MPVALSLAQNDDFASVTFRYSKPSPQHDFIVTAMVQITRPCRDVVIFGRSAKAMFYMSGNSTWRWTVSRRLLERDTLYPDERVAVDILRRPHEGVDRVRIFEGDEELGTGAGTANLYQVELVVSAAGQSQIKRRQCYQFYPPDSGKISLPLEPSSLPYIIKDEEK